MLSRKYVAGESLAVQQLVAISLTFAAGSVCDRGYGLVTIDLYGGCGTRQPQSTEVLRLLSDAAQRIVQTKQGNISHGLSRTDLAGK